MDIWRQRRLPWIMCLGLVILFQSAYAGPNELGTPFCSRTVKDVLSIFRIHDHLASRNQPMAHLTESNSGYDEINYYQTESLAAQVRQNWNLPGFQRDSEAVAAVIMLSGLGPKQTVSRYGDDITYSPSIMVKFKHPTEDGSKCEPSIQIGLSVASNVLNKESEHSANDFLLAPRNMASFGRFSLNQAFCKMLNKEPSLSEEEIRLGIILKDYEARYNRFIALLATSGTDPDRFTIPDLLPSPKDSAKIAEDEQLRVIIPLAFRACLIWYL